MATAQDWLIVVRPLAGGFKYWIWADGLTAIYINLALTPSDLHFAPLKSLQFNSDGQTDSRWARWEFDARDNLMGLEPYDDVQICTKGVLGTEIANRYYPRWRGFASVPTNAQRRDGRPHQYRALGMREALYWVDLGSNVQYDAGLDITEYAEAVIYLAIGDGQMPYSLTSYKVGGVMPPIGVEAVSDINFGSHSLGEALDALVTLANRSGAGNFAWGVTPYGLIWLRAVDTGVSYFVQDDPATQCVVTLDDITSDELANRVRWALGAGSIEHRLFNTISAIKTSTPDALTHLSESGIGTYGPGTRLVQADSETPVFKQIPGTLSLTAGTLIASYNAGTADTTPSLDRILDDNPYSYAVIEADGAGLIQLEFIPAIDTPLNTIVGASVEAREANTSDDITAGAILLSMKDNVSGAGTRGHYLLVGKLGTVTNTAISWGLAKGSPAAKTYIQAGDRTRSPATTGSGITLSLAGLTLQGATDGSIIRFAVQDFRVYALDTDLLDGLAENEYRFPYQDALTAEVRGYKPPTGLADVQLREADTLTMLETTEWTYSLTPDRDWRTEVRVGPRFDPALVEEQSVLRRKLTAATIKAARAGKR